jgi:hypothetical protein
MNEGAPWLTFALFPRRDPPMRRGFTLLLIACCLGGLLAACYGRVLWGGEQFGYRDAVQYFYPLYWRVQAEWQEGRVPLWEPGENAGTPLLGNPSAAVLYPGKVLYAWLPYPWAARLYVVAHTVGAFLAMLGLLRTWGASAVASALAGLAYAFGAPILFQYCNVIYLVGAVWAPLGVRAADRWVRQGRRLAVIELAVVLSMIVLGGEPETAYLMVVVAVGYAVAKSLAPGRAGRPLVVCVGAMIVAAAWVVGTLELARWLPAWRVPRPGDLPPAALPWMRWVPTAVMLAWALGGALALTRPSATLSQGERDLRRRLLGLAGAAGIALGLAAAQVLPALEFSAETDRASVEDPIDVYPFSLEPIRMVELVWPNSLRHAPGGQLLVAGGDPPRLGPGYARVGAVAVPRRADAGAGGGSRRVPRRTAGTRLADGGGAHQSAGELRRVHGSALVGALASRSGRAGGPARPPGGGCGRDPSRWSAPRR